MVAGINRDYIRNISMNYFGLEVAFDKGSSAATGAGYTNTRVQWRRGRGDLESGETASTVNMT